MSSPTVPEADVVVAATSTSKRSSPSKRGSKRTSSSFQFKPVITVINKGQRNKREMGINITTFIECPRASPDEPPRFLISSPVEHDEFLEYFGQMILPGMRHIFRDGRYRKQNVLQAIEAARAQREQQGPDRLEDQQVETLFLSPDTEQYTKPQESGEAPLLTTPYHRKAGI